MKKALIDLYKKNKIFDVPLHLDCPNCLVCWPKPDLNDLKPYSREELFIYHPWIGKNYGSFKLLVLGINMNQDSGKGDILKQEKYVVQAKSEILEGKQKILRNKGYGGTVYWHRLPSYIAILLEREKLISLTWTDDFPTKEHISLAYDYAAITNIIKCSPNQDNEKGTPTSPMWKSCSEFILKEEIDIMKPDKILLLGLENYDRFKENVFDFPPMEVAGNKSFKKGNGIINGCEIEYYVIVHPTSLGENAGSRRSLMLEFNEFLYDKQIEEIKSGINLIAQRNNLEVAYFDEPLGRGDSGFYFFNKTWSTNISIGFGFDESWGQNFFYGIYKQNKLNPAIIDKIRECLKLKNDSYESVNFPIWFWFYGQEHKSQNILVNLEVNNFLINIELKLQEILNKIKEANIVD